jgi:hypothetical protein
MKMKKVVRSNFKPQIETKMKKGGGGSERGNNQHTQEQDWRFWMDISSSAAAANPARPRQTCRVFHQT